MTYKPTYEELEQRILELERAEYERKRAEEELRMSESQFRNAFEHSAIGMALVSPEGKWLKVNTRVCDILGYTEDELMRKTFQDITHPEDLDADLEFVRRMLAGEIETYQMEKRYFHKDGRIVWVLLAVSLVWDDQGVPLHFISQIEDITERKRAEEALLESREKTKLFAYSVSHDLKSPSTAIYGLAKRLQEGCADVLDVKSKVYCDQILGAAEHISTLVHQINDYISASQAALTIEKFNLKDILQMVREEFSEQLGIRQIRWSEPENLPELSADRIAVQRVLRNLVDNALKYGGENFTELKIDHEDTGAFHVISVSNNGAMIREEHIRTVFGPFQRYETARGVNGSGLGLTIIRDLAEKHGGKAWVESELDRLTTFYVSISKNL